MAKRPLRVLTWHIHGSYLSYLAHVPHTFYLPTKPGKPEGYGGRLAGFDWPDNVRDIPADDVHRTAFDCILFQSHKNYTTDQYEILSDQQRRLPRIFLEHDPPRDTPTDTRHVVDDPAVLLVHVTHFNQLMWDSGRTPSHVIEHGVTIPADVHYSGEIEKGITIVNGLARRGRRLGRDVFDCARHTVPLDLVGMCAAELGGVGEIPHRDLPAVAARYRFFFNPIRYTSLGLAVCEAMMVGLPIIGLATTEMATVVQNGVNGFVDTNLGTLVRHMQRLIEDPVEARALSVHAARYARERFGIERFVHDWDRIFSAVCG
ncbi:MAG: glycosyltransferase family 4 protein [Chloroflexaceae bacterium]|nr:glycosyltransferase family 4 protein [Chloroflexaceae bacterium]NJL32892.1 glycosyltransferase family 4 protein [Chloroflexaceae bacterium]